MGMLRVAGAIGGAGQGLAAVGEAIQKERMQHLELQREMALMGLKAQYEQAQQGRQFAHEDVSQGVHESGENARSAATIAGAGARNEADIKARGAEGAANRSASMARTEAIVAGREKAAKIHAQGTNKMQSRFAFDKASQPTTLTSQGITGGGQLPLVHDRQTGNTFQQVGTRFILQGVDPKSFARPLSKPQQQQMSAAESYLMQHPETEGTFLNTYRYLPAQFVNSRPQMKVSSPAGAPDDASEDAAQTDAENSETQNPADNEPAVEPGTQQ